MIVEAAQFETRDDMNTDSMAPGFSQNMEWDQRKKTILHIHKKFTENF